jgi:hypothetical protein
MLTTIEQKLSAIKAINDKISQLEIARQRIDLDQGITWDLIPEGTKALINDTVRECYNQQKDELIAKASELMK